MKGLILIGAFVLAVGTTFVANWLSLIPWRKSKGMHWSEQARLLYPVAVAARVSLWAIPAILVLTVVMVWPNTSPLWLFTGIVSMLGTHIGTLFFDREIFPQIPVRELLIQVVLGWLIKFFIWFVFICAAVSMPVEFNLTTWTIAGAVFLTWILWIKYGWIWLGRAFGFLKSAPEGLRNIAVETSVRMNIPYREVLLMRSPFCQAYAVPGKNILIFTERLIELLPDDEIAAVCAHELAHLTEPRAIRYVRTIQALTYLPWIFFTPLIHNYGIFPFYGLLFLTMMAPRIFRKISRKLESRADIMAKANEGDEGTYARALARIYEDRLTPAVIKKRSTHPNLYDRLVAAGVTPDFPRPAPASTMAWHGIIFSALAGMLFSIFAINLAVQAGWLAR